MDENFYVDGIIHGSVEVHGTLEINESGLVEGEEVRCENIVVSGILKANLIVAEKSIVIYSTAKVEGEIIASNISIEEGATVCGSMKAGYSPQAIGEFVNAFNPGALSSANTNSLAESSSANSANSASLDLGVVKSIMRQWNSEEPFFSGLDQQR